MEHPKILHNGVLVHTTNSEGQRIHPSDEGIKNFHDWFSGSKTIDEHGRPQVHYHGSGADISEFKPKMPSKGLVKSSHLLDFGIHFADHIDTANEYAHNSNADFGDRRRKAHSSEMKVGNPNVTPVYIKTKNMLDMTKELPPDISDKVKNLGIEHGGMQKTSVYFQKYTEPLRTLGAVQQKVGRWKLKKIFTDAGYDGIKYPFGYSETPSNSVVIFHPNQIKSAIGNSGSFSTSHKITESFKEYRLRMIEGRNIKIAESVNHPMIEVDGGMQHATNSEGNRIHVTDEGIKNFHRWSEGKHLKDIHGRPAVVYHGTDTNFNVVNPDKGAMGSFWFASHKGDVADSGAVSTKIIKPPVYQNE